MGGGGGGGILAAATSVGQQPSHYQLHLRLLLGLGNNVSNFLVALALQRSPVPLDNLVTCTQKGIVD